MRLPIIIGATLLLSVGLNIPVMSQSAIEIAQIPKANNLDLRRLNFNRRLWNEQNISNYRYTLSNGCFCIPEARGPVIIEVRNGQATITSVATGQPVANPEFFAQYNTIPKLFNVIQDALNRQAYSLNINYSPRLGYPTQINIDYDSQIADEEIYLTIENFEVIQ
ncbi:hypothetical protein H6G76_35730 [Nostoc sp. FACHB-152]|uniref:DUF6174 domain-containing protein n=1 Tax=unclassified Nostoc TaxID=2593658 RepID=UPI001686F6E0|nr:MULTISPECIES: DUF6174 domain-containing protein [unclassified Nostoc]MBD2452360.1 hypothetical protein [Nostoc sp. FACHB-152]MBD2473254.1 hypothetical protein [Nostoc sp. FACHB-145]